MVVVPDGTKMPATATSACCGTTPAPRVMRHADAGYDIATDCAKEQGLDLPMVC